MPNLLATNPTDISNINVIRRMNAKILFAFLENNMLFLLI